MTGPMNPPDGFTSWLDWATRPYVTVGELDEPGVRYHLKIELTALRARIRDLEAAIQRALDDEESGTGWGPDITVCAYLRAALSPPPTRTEGTR